MTQDERDERAERDARDGTCASSHRTSDFAAEQSETKSHRPKLARGVRLPPSISNAPRDCRATGNGLASIRHPAAQHRPDTFGGTRSREEHVKAAKKILDDETFHNYGNEWKTVGEESSGKKGRLKMPFCSRPRTGAIPTLSHE